MSKVARWDKLNLQCITRSMNQWEVAQTNSMTLTIQWVLTPIRTRRTQDSQTQHVEDSLKVMERDQEVSAIVREKAAEFQLNVVLAARCEYSKAKNK